MTLTAAALLLALQARRRSQHEEVDVVQALGVLLRQLSEGSSHKAADASGGTKTQIRAR